MTGILTQLSALIPYGIRKESAKNPQGIRKESERNRKGFRKCCVPDSALNVGKQLSSKVSKQQSREKQCSHSSAASASVTAKTPKSIGNGDGNE